MVKSNELMSDINKSLSISLNKRSALNARIAQCFKSACMAEIEALKPGNVHIFADGHGMTVQDFIDSADAVSQVIVVPDLSLGQRILYSVQATQKAVGCNTNLGIILLCAPMVQAILTPVNTNFHSNLMHVLQQSTIEDAQLAFTAIALANPAGLGEAEQYDVRKYDMHQTANCTLLQAMQAAAHRDLIAAQYSNNFDAIFNLGLPLFNQASHLHRSWITTKLYLTFLSTFADSHIKRKHGAKVAADIQQQAKQHLTAFNLLDNPKRYQGKLLAWDHQLKQTQINPGTSADLTVAVLFADALNNLMTEV